MPFLIDNLPNLLVFARVVSTGSLSAAARDMNLSLAVVSKRLARLEKSLGVRLIQRTTRRQTLTEEGVILHAQVLRILAEVEEAEALMSNRTQAVTGVLRITAPGEFGRQWLAPLLADFGQLHPQLAVHMELTDVVVDLLASGTDLAIRFGGLPRSSMVARPLAPNHRVLCAAPAYLKKYGMPKHPNDLAKQRCILIGRQPSAQWHFEGKESVSVRVAGALVTNDGGAAHEWALRGVGIALKSIWDVGDDISTGRLKHVLPGYTMPAAPLHAIYSHGRHVPPRIKATIDYLRERLSKAWRWDRL